MSVTVLLVNLLLRSSGALDIVLEQDHDCPLNGGGGTGEYTIKRHHKPTPHAGVPLAPTVRNAKSLNAGRQLDGLASSIDA